MPRRLALARHLSMTDLERHDRRCRTPVERTRWHMLWLIAQGHGVPEAARTVGYRADWARTLVHRYNAEGPAGLRDRRQDNRGRAPLLDASQLEALRVALGAAPPDGGVWTSPKVAAWMEARLGRPVAAVRGWEALQRLGFSLQRPRPRATTADPEAQDAVKKGGSSAPSMR